MAVATWSDVETALGRPLSSSAEQDQVEWWLTGIELFITARLGDVALLDATTVVYVEAEAAAAKVRRHGTAESSITVSVDDGSVTRRYEHPVSASDIADDWWQLLDPDSNAASASIRPGFEADTAQWSVSTPPRTDMVFQDWDLIP